ESIRSRLASETHRDRLIYERVPLGYFVGRASRQRSDAPLASRPHLAETFRSRSTISERAGTEGFVQWDTTATLLNGNSSYFKGRMRRTRPYIGERNNSLCPLSCFSHSSPW